MRGDRRTWLVLALLMAVFAVKGLLLVPPSAPDDKRLRHRARDRAA